MLPIYVKEAETYSIAVESAPKKALELKKEPVFEWLNPARKRRSRAPSSCGCATAGPRRSACVFSHPHAQAPGRQVMHELHALDPEKLLVKRDEYNEWKPEAGLARKELPDAPAPADDRRRAAAPDEEAGRRSSPATASTATRSGGTCDCCRPRSTATRPRRPA